MKPPVLQIDARELALVKSILTEKLPPTVRASIFGSRAGGQPKRFSDLDLSLDGGAPLPLVLLAQLAEAFDESLLPWKVDLVDRRTVNPAFGKIIDATKIDLP